MMTRTRASKAPDNASREADGEPSGFKLSLVAPSDSLEFLSILFNGWYERNKVDLTTNGIHRDLLTDWNAIAALPRSYKAFKAFYGRASALDGHIKGIRWNTNERLQLGPIINRHYAKEIQLFLDWQTDRDAIVLDARDEDVLLAVPDIQPDSDATGSIAPRKIDNTDDDDDSIAKSDRFWRMESDSDIAAKAARSALRSPKYELRTDNHRQLSLRIDILVQD